MITCRHESLFWLPSGQLHMYSVLFYLFIFCRVKEEESEWTERPSLTENGSMIKRGVYIVPRLSESQLSYSPPITRRHSLNTKRRRASRGFKKKKVEKKFVFFFLLLTASSANISTCGRRRKGGKGKKGVKENVQKKEIQYRRAASSAVAAAAAAHGMIALRASLRWTKLLLLLVMMSIYKREWTDGQLFPPFFSPQWLSYLMRVVCPSVTVSLCLDEEAHFPSTLIVDSPEKGRAAADPFFLRNTCCCCCWLRFWQKHILDNIFKVLCQQAVLERSKKKGPRDESIRKAFFNYMIYLFDFLCRLHPISHFSLFYKKRGERKKRIWFRRAQSAPSVARRRDSTLAESSVAVPSLCNSVCPRTANR